MPLDARSPAERHKLRFISVATPDNPETIVCSLSESVGDGSAPVELSRARFDDLLRQAAGLGIMQAKEGARARAERAAKAFPPQWVKLGLFRAWVVATVTVWLSATVAEAGQAGSVCRGWWNTAWQRQVLPDGPVGFACKVDPLFLAMVWGLVPAALVAAGLFGSYSAIVWIWRGFRTRRGAE